MIFAGDRNKYIDDLFVDDNEVRQKHKYIVYKRGLYLELANKTNLDRSFIRRVLKGERGITLRNAATLAEAIGITLDSLWQHIETERRKR
jgi:transcriptional regulator with XRE-family HTH domain